MAVSEAVHLASDEASASGAPPPLTSAAARVSRRAAATSRAISAIMNRRPCISASGAPNALRSWRYAAAPSMAAWARPTHAAQHAEGCRGDLVALPLPAQPVRGGHDAPVEHELRGRA